MSYIDPPPRNEDRSRNDRRRGGRYRYPSPYGYGYPYATPAPVACPAGTTAYTVQPGDSLYVISTRYGIDPQMIMSTNPGVNFNYLQVGQIICL